MGRGETHCAWAAGSCFQEQQKFLEGKGYWVPSEGRTSVCKDPGGVGGRSNVGLGLLP